MSRLNCDYKYFQKTPYRIKANVLKNMQYVGSEDGFSLAVMGLDPSNV